MTGKTGLSSAHLRPCTLKTSEFKVSLPDVSGSEICLVDTRGFGTEMDGIETFKKITNWWIYMLVIYSRKYSGGYFNEPWLFREEGGHELVGLLYFHDIAANLWTGSYGMNLKCFQQLCEEDLTKLIFTTTMWDDVDEDEGTKWEEELKADHLRPILEGGASVQRFLNNRQSAIEILSLRVNDPPGDVGNAQQGAGPQPPPVPPPAVLSTGVVPPLYVPHGVGTAPPTFVVLPIPLVLLVDTVPERSQAGQRKLGNGGKVRSKEAGRQEERHRLEDERNVEETKQRIEEEEHKRAKHQRLEEERKVRCQWEEKCRQEERYRFEKRSMGPEKRKQQQQSEEEGQGRAGRGWLQEDLRREEEERIWAEFLRSEEKLRCEEGRIQRQLIEELRSMRAEQSQRNAKLDHMRRQREDREQRPGQAWERGKFQGKPQPSTNIFQGVENVTFEQATFTMVVNSQPDEGGPTEEH